MLLIFELSTYVCDFFFFSSRRRHTRYIGDWSSDVCSSDLSLDDEGLGVSTSRMTPSPSSSSDDRRGKALDPFIAISFFYRSEERRVGKECSSWCSRYQCRKKRMRYDMRAMLQSK